MNLRRLLLTPCLLSCTFLLTAVAQAAGGHQQITGPFFSVENVTLQCLGCHAQQGQDLLRSTHWTWQRQRNLGGTKATTLSKAEELTTFAVAAASNPQQCLTCHISTSMATGTLDPESALHIDCLICHDNTGHYRRDQGQPAADLNLVDIARNVGIPSQANCTTCHGANCGLPSTADHQGMEPDIHFTPAGGNLSCLDCHPAGKSHHFARTPSSGPGAQQTGCLACHPRDGHRLAELNRHSETIDCRTCHIPAYGMATPTIVSWNWLARCTPPLRQQDDSPLIDQNGFTLARGVQPTLLWSDGSETIYQRGARIDPGQTTVLRGPGKRSARSTLRPFASTYATQLYDQKYRYLISPKLGGAEQLFPPGSWDKIAEDGMREVRLPYSGSHAFTTTVSYRPLSHGVRAASEALDCMDCHGQHGRLAWQESGYTQDPWPDKASTPQAPTPVPGQEQHNDAVPHAPVSALPGT